MGFALDNPEAAQNLSGVVRGSALMAQGAVGQDICAEGRRTARDSPGASIHAEVYFQTVCPSSVTSHNGGRPLQVI